MRQVRFNIDPIWEAGIVRAAWFRRVGSGRVPDAMQSRTFVEPINYMQIRGTVHCEIA